ncbi:protein FAM91A1 isoform X1 [Strongylocentrotus purpuratus]|uniref:Protein FAM91A1 n=1 Tax=Strongylocentrotus purpuratus TaxID=7668 RepID=A0A7M7GHC5_STRPU|nr:protein FAM91A1 isoform X1 [Strongylocentrotus purpuratus]
MNSEVEFHIRNNYPWGKLPANIKQLLGHSPKEYEKCVSGYSIKNQLRFKGNLIRQVKKDDRKYYEDLLKYSRDHLMLYPYHLSDITVKGLRITPFSYYLSMMHDIMSSEKSYDSLPNFTAADCLRLLGIGRNQYIEIMNQCRSSKPSLNRSGSIQKFFRRKPIRDLLPGKPIEDVSVEAWWMVQAGYITEDDIRTVSIAEKNAIDRIIDTGSQPAGAMDYYVVHKLYLKGLVYVDVPIEDDDYISVPPLEGFVMNRLQGDYFEKLLYKIFVSIDEHTTVAELSNVLQIDLGLVKNAVSMYCRLGFARRKGQDLDMEALHPSWQDILQANGTKKPTVQDDLLLIDWGAAQTSNSEKNSPSNEGSIDTLDMASVDESDVTSSSITATGGHTKRIAFLFDSTLTAFLMMGNLSPGLKSHAVTMFEVGKLSDESLDSFLAELDRVPKDSVVEGEAQRYFEHAVILKNTITFLRYNKDISPDPDGMSKGMGIDLLRCESLLGLEPATCARVLQKNYDILVSMAPLSNEIRPISSCTPQHIGPAIPEVNSVWFKLYLYHVVQSGPSSLLLVKGSRLRYLPLMFQEYDRLLITTWGHDPGLVSTSNALFTINDALAHSAVLIQAHGWLRDGETICVPFPLDESTRKGHLTRSSMHTHKTIKKLEEELDLTHSCGYITLLRSGCLSAPTPLPSNQETKAEGKDDEDAQNQLTASQLSEAADDEESPGLEEAVGGQAAESESLDIEKAKDLMQLPLETREVPEGNDRVLSEEMESNWALLDLSFGVPLFDEFVNQEVCQRIAEKRLCQKKSLEYLLHSSRKLSLQLLNFIARQQDLPVVPDLPADAAMTPSSTQRSQSPTLPYPTRNLVFQDGKLGVWDPMSR